LDIVERNDIFELEAFVGLMKNASRLYEKASFVQKRIIASIICLNITVSNKKRLHLAVKPLFKELIALDTHNGG